MLKRGWICIITIVLVLVIIFLCTPINKDIYYTAKNRRIERVVEGVVFASDPIQVPWQYEKKIRDVIRDISPIDNDYSGYVKARKIIDEFLPDYSTARDKAITLNQIGYSYYKKEDYSMACVFFAYSAFTDETYKYPFYNYACSMTLFQPNGEPGFVDDSMVEYLKKAIELDENYKQKMRVDPDFKIYQKEAWFIILSGADPSTYAGIKDILMNTEVWYGPKPGIYPQSPELVFKKDGTLIVRYFCIYEEDFSCSYGWEESQGSYTIHDGYIMIDYNNTSYKGVFKESRLFINGFSFHPYFTTTVDVSA